MSGMVWYCPNCRYGPLNPNIDVACPNCGWYKTSAAGPNLYNWQDSHLESTTYAGVEETTFLQDTIPSRLSTLSPKNAHDPTPEDSDQSTHIWAHAQPSYSSGSPSEPSLQYHSLGALSTSPSKPWTPSTQKPSDRLPPLRL